MNALLFSGGIDSTALAWAHRPDQLVFIDYGQVPAPGEERACRSIAAHLGLQLLVKKVDLRSFGAGPLAGLAAVSKDAPEFWPYRNQLLITLSLMALHVQRVETLMIGTVKTDSVHPDGRPEFLNAIAQLVAAQGGPTIVAPAAEYETADLVRSSGLPEAVLGWTFSCHTGEWACGNCRGCSKHHDVLSKLAKAEN